MAGPIGTLRNEAPLCWNADCYPTSCRAVGPSIRARDRSGRFGGRRYSADDDERLGRSQPHVGPPPAGQAGHRLR